MNTNWIKNLREKTEKSREQNKVIYLDESQLTKFQNIHPSQNPGTQFNSSTQNLINGSTQAPQPGKLDFLKKRQDKTLTEGQSYADKLLEKGQDILKNDTGPKQHRFREQINQNSYCKQDTRFNPILSSQKFQVGPGRYRQNKINGGEEIEYQMVSTMDKRNNTYNEQRKISLPYKKFITFEIVSQATFGIRFHKFYDEQIKNKIRDIQGAKFLMDQRIWIVGLPYYDELFESLKKVCEIARIHIEEIPTFIMNLVLHKIPFTGPDIQIGNFNYTNDPFASFKIEEMPPSIYNNLMPHQKLAITKCLKRNGRIIINDSMGMGKKLTSIGISLIYKPEWPLLIICPHALRHQWFEEFIKWIPNIKPEYIQIFGSSTDEEISTTAKIFIISYQLISTKEMMLKFDSRKEGRFKVCIADQASYLKQEDSDWSQLVVPFLISMKRIILLTGSNFSYNPFEIYNLMKIIRPDYIPDFLNFCYRYCDPVKKQQGVEFTGRSFHQELELLFMKRFAIRRTRDDKNIQISVLNRQKIEIIGLQPVTISIQKDIDAKYLEYENQNQNTSVFQDILLKKKDQFQNQEQRVQFIKDFEIIFKKTGLSKLKQILEINSILLENGISFIFVAYNETIIESVKQSLKKSNVQFVNLNNFFESVENSSQTQNIIIEEIAQLQELFDTEGKRFQDHLVVGILSYQKFIKGFKKIQRQDQYEKFKIQCQKHFEAVLFAEYHWKIDVIKQIEQIITPKNTLLNIGKNNSQDKNVEPALRLRNSYFIKSRGTVDEYLSRLLYHQDLELWKQIENQEVANFNNQNAQNKLDDFKVNFRIENIKQILAKHLEAQKIMLENDISVTCKAFEFQHPPTQSFYDRQTDQMILSQRIIDRQPKYRATFDGPHYDLNDEKQNCKMNESIKINNPELDSQEQEDLKYACNPNSQLNKFIGGKKNKDQMKQQKLILKKIEKIMVTQNSFEGTSDVDENESMINDTQLYPDRTGNELNMETQISHISERQENSVTQSNITQITQQSCKSLSATQLKRNLGDTQITNKNSQLTQSGLSQQRTLKDFQKVGFGFYINKKQKNQQEEEQLNSNQQKKDINISDEIRNSQELDQIQIGKKRQRNEKGLIYDEDIEKQVQQMQNPFKDLTEDTIKRNK
ncbi:SNF2 family N-terminal domain containing protein [Oxytricha trifallax]|uniref:SNF2 family N-terminal domain containing protein n=1 Tax=Oxytricha trifallax TaxID=1172189 RepID=A0A073HYJ8_9SPIT|nr:SNF2 family N-terminal domain containing protein [Oxytricha trifallax]